MNNYNKFLEFIGTDWITEEYQKFRSDPSLVTHPFILSHSNILSSRQYADINNKLFLPKEIYLTTQVLPFKRYELLGTYIKAIEPLIQNPVKYKNRLRNEREFQGALYELIAICILFNSNYTIIKIKEDDGKTPDLFVNKGIKEYTVEVTVKNEPDNLDNEKESANILVEHLSKVLQENNISGQIGIVSNYSFKDNVKMFLQLCEEIIANKKIGWNSFSNNNVKVIFNELGKWDDCISVDSFINNNYLLSYLPFNMGSSLEYSTITTKEIKNIVEVALNYSIDINKGIKSTLINKINKNQVIKSVPATICIFIPHNILLNYEINSELINGEIENILSQSQSHEAVFIITEYFGQRNGIWEFNYDIMKINNPRITEEDPFVIRSFETEIYSVNDPNR